MKRKQLTEACCLAKINDDGEDAFVLLTDNLPGAEQSFFKIDKALCNFLKRVRRVFPDAEFYTASGGFNLLLGHSHSDKSVPQQELIALSGQAQIGDGDF